jgi:hypothetical protein
METIIDISFKFPIEDTLTNQKLFDKLWKFCKGIEGIEIAFDIEFSCGDGKFMSDFWKWSDSGEGLCCTVSDEELKKYDGEVDLKSLPRFADTKKLFQANKWYRFTVKVDKDEQYHYYLNSKKKTREW